MHTCLHDTRTPHPATNPPCGFMLTLYSLSDIIDQKLYHHLDSRQSVTGPPGSIKKIIELTDTMSLNPSVT